MDRLILKMRFEQRMRVADISRALHLEQRPLYRTFERIQATIRARMAADGITKADIDALFEDVGVMWMGESDSATAMEAAAATPAAEDERSSWRQD